MKAKNIKECSAEKKYKDEMYCWWYLCSNCRNINIAKEFDYCPDCGYKVISLVNPKELNN